MSPKIWSKHEPGIPCNAPGHLDATFFIFTWKMTWSWKERLEALPLRMIHAVPSGRFYFLKHLSLSDDDTVWKQDPETLKWLWYLKILLYNGRAEPEAESIELPLDSA